jgi:lipoprotein NlpI
MPVHGDWTDGADVMLAFVNGSPTSRACGARVFLICAAMVAAAVAWYLDIKEIREPVEPALTAGASNPLADEKAPGAIRAILPATEGPVSDTPRPGRDDTRTRQRHQGIVRRFASMAATQASAETPQAIFNRAVADFLNGRIAESVAGFDDLARLAPASAPELWQRGIALYYAGRYNDCRQQFEMHRTVNPNDVENAAWHYLCVARAQSPEAARTALLPVGRDSRVPMRQIYDLFRGAATPDDVLTAAARDPASEFYAHLYLGLYFEALGNKPRALTHITVAAADRYARIAGYMHGVARVHLRTLQQQQ